MTVKVAFIGTGTCRPSGRNPSCLAMAAGDDTVLVDCGGGSYHRLSLTGDSSFDPGRIRTLFLTHFHMDHVAGLPDLIWGEMWKQGGPRSEPLTIVGPAGLRDFVERRLMTFVGDYAIPFPVKTIELHDRDSFVHPLFTAELYYMSHSGGSTGYLFEIDGLRFSVTGDTGYCPGLAGMLKRSDVAVMEWAHSVGPSGASHMSGDDLLRLRDEGALPPRVYAVHLYLPEGVTFEEQVLNNRALLGCDADRIIFPDDGDVEVLVS